MLIPLSGYESFTRAYIIIVDAYSVLAGASDSLLGETKPLCCLIMCSSITLYCIIHCVQDEHHSGWASEQDHLQYSNRKRSISETAVHSCLESYYCDP